MERFDQIAFPKWLRSYPNILNPSSTRTSSRGGPRTRFPHAYALGNTPLQPSGGRKSSREGTQNTALGIFFFSSADFFLLGDARGANSAHATLRVHWNFEESQAILHRSHLVESCTVRHQMTSSQHQAQIPKPVLVSKTFDRPASLSQYQFWDINLRTAILFSTNHSSEREPGLLQLLPE